MIVAYYFRGRGGMSSRFDPYSAPSGNSWMPRSEMYSNMTPHGMDGPYHAPSYRAGGGNLMAPPPSARPSGSVDDMSFARELLQLYTKDPAAFDAYARNPEVRRSLNLESDPTMHSQDDSYLKTPREYVMEQRMQQRYAELW